MTFSLSVITTDTGVCGVQVLNDVVVDRGPSSYLSNVDLFLDGHLITTVQGDGERCVRLSAADLTSDRWDKCQSSLSFPACGGTFVSPVVLTSFDKALGKC